MDAQLVLMSEHFPDAVKDLLGFLADFGTNPFSGENDDLEVHEQPCK